MKRAVPLLFAVAVVLSCQQDQPSPTSPLITNPQAAIIELGNGHFFWLPELVPQPASFNGVFNPDLPPTILLCQLNGNIDPLACAQPYQTLFGPSQINVSLVNEHYSAVWHTSDSNLDSNEYYRMTVVIGTDTVGHRDLNPEDEPPPIDKSAPFYAFNNGNAINIKFRMEFGLFCAGGDPTACGECTFETNGEAGNNNEFDRVCNADAGAGIFIPEGELPQTTVVIPERVQCPDLDPVTRRVRFFQGLDLPQYGGCMSIRSEPPLDPGTRIEFMIVGLCPDVPAGFTQEDKLVIHKTPDASDPNARVEATNNVDAPFVDCAAFAAANTPPLLRLAQQAWRTFSPLSAKKAYAVHAGRGGEIISFTDFVWALPSQMEILEGDGQTALTGTSVAVSPAVLITDEDLAPVEGARVWFEVTVPNNGGFVVADMPTITGSDGIARVTSWTLGNDPGINVLEASGFGIGVRGEAWTAPDGRVGVGPFTHTTVTDPAGTDNRDPIPVQRGDVEFTAIGCQPGIGAAGSIDGVLSSGEWDCAITAPFEANVGGGKKPSTYYWMRTATDFYFAVRIPVDETSALKENTLTLYLNAVGDLALMAGHDVLVVDGTAAPGAQFSDLHWDDSCPKGQSFCALDDGLNNGRMPDGEGAFSVNTASGGAFYFYEIRHPLVSGDPFDINFIDTIHSFFTLRGLGNGNKGDTDHPEFGAYEQIVP